jgi:hypothetical protein
LLKNAQKYHQKKVQVILKNKEGTFLLHLVAICQIYVASIFVLFSAPWCYCYCS